MQQGPPTASESLECHPALGFLLDPSGLCVRWFDVVRVILNISQITSPPDKLNSVWSSCSARVQKLSVSQTHLSSDHAAKAGSRQTALTLWTQPKKKHTTLLKPHQLPSLPASSARLYTVRNVCIIVIGCYWNYHERPGSFTMEVYCLIYTFIHWNSPFIMTGDQHVYSAS